MTQHTQPVVAAQHQNQQQQQHHQQTSTAQQQNTTTPNSNNNNNNASNNNNNNNTNSTPTTTTNNNQTQTVAVQQHQNNNNNNSYQNATGGQMFNPQLQSANVYLPAHPHPHHHSQPHHHHQAGAMYQTMIPAAIPSNVFVNNVTANVNLHGWPHTVPHGTWVPAGSAAPQYLHGELPPEQGAPVIQPLGGMPLTIPTPNALAGPVMNPNPPVITGGGGGTRGSTRGRGRGGSSGSRRGEYNMQRHSHAEGSPAPQQGGQNNQQDIQQPGQQPADAQQMMTTLQPSYVQHPQYASYPYGYPTYFVPQQHMIHPGQSAAAQHATGTPLYFQPMPVYNGPHMYNYGYYVPQVINQADYPYGEEVGVGDERVAAAGDGSMMWPQQPIYADEYAMGAGPEMHAVPPDDINHNASSIGSANETPNLLSPNYTPMYEQMTQQMGVMQIYDDPQMGQMQVMHRQGAVQLDDEISECGSQPSMQMVAPQPIQIVPAAAVSPMTLTANSNEQILQQQQQQTPHLIPVSGDNIIPTESSLTTNNTTTPQQQIQQQPTIIGDSTDEATSQRYDHHVAHNAKKLDANLNEETVQSTDEQLAPSEQMLQQQQIEMQQELEKQKSYDNSKKFGETVQTTDDNLIKKDYEPQLPQEQKLQQQQKEMEAQTSYNNSFNSKSFKSTTDVAIETVATNVVTNRQQQQTQHDRPHKQQQPQQYVSKQNVPQETQQQQQYQHQQLQTQPITPVVQQQQQPTHYQKSNQQQQQQQPQHHHHHQTSNQQHQPQQSYDNRKSSQMYNPQHQLRNRKYDYHYNDGSSHQQQSSQQQTKTMSWTNSSQHKKSTNTVGVTATPTSSHSSSSHNKSSNATNTSSTHTHGSRSYYQQHTNYQQQNYHYQQQQQQQHQHQHQPTTRNHAAMKMPSSPISSGPNTMERKSSQSSDAGKQTQQQTTSTASTTAAPHQFQQQQPQQSQQTSTNDMVSTQQVSASTAVSTGSTSTSISSKQSQPSQQQQQSQHNPPGFATKKHSLSNQGHSSSSFATNSSTVSSTATSNAVETSNTPAINLAPPVTAQTTPVAPSTPSWASLFASSSNASSTTNSSNTSASANNSLAAASNSSSTTSSGLIKKPIAKVAPYEGITPVTPPPPVVTPGTLSYSAASAQNLPPPSSANNTTTAAKKSSATSASSEQQSQRNSLANLDEYSVKFAEFLTKYKSDWAPISLRPRGLTNRSNYCYINSILQALLGCSPLYNLIRSIPKQAANLCEVKTPTVNAMITFMSNFSNLPSGLRLRTTKGGKGNKDDLGGDLQCDPAFEPTEIYKLWNDSREEHVEGRQEDAEEFLSYILNKLNDEMLEVIKLIAKPNPEQNGQNEPPEEDGDVWQMICNNRNKGSVTRQTDFGCTPLSDIFRGELRSRLQREGEHSTDVIQPFFTLQLNIEKAASVKEALEILVGRDQLEGVTGSKSKQEVVAWQQMNLEKLPPILILHLKWFDYRSDGCTKILKKVEFPVELKIDTKILASKNYSQKKRAYRLFAVVYHDGKEATKGHYITDVYHTGYGSWLRYDDSSVKPVSENHVLLPRTPRVPYLLCYRRCDTIPQQSNNNQNNNNSSGNTQSSTGK